MNFPKHKCGLYLTHNEHLDYYESAATRITDLEVGDDEWATPEEKHKAIETNELWQLQWYPETPIGFHRIFAASLDVLLEAAARIEEGE